MPPKTIASLITGALILFALIILATTSTYVERWW